MSLAFPKPTPSEDRITKKRQRERDLQVAGNAVWIRDNHKCRACGRRVIRSNGAGIRGHVHHLVKRSQSKAHRADPESLVLTCALCHADIHGYRLIAHGSTQSEVRFERLPQTPIPPTA